MIIEELPDWQQRFVIEYRELLTKTIKLGNMMDSRLFATVCDMNKLFVEYWGLKWWTIQNIKKDAQK